MKKPIKIELKKKCACKGSNLDRFIQPIILLILCGRECTGYSIIKMAGEYSMFRGGSPDATGMYRYLKLMEGRGLIASNIYQEAGTDKTSKKYHITEEGKKCLANWKTTLVEYRTSINELIAEMEGIF